MTEKLIDLKQKIEFSSHKIVKKGLLDAGCFNLALICLDAGQEIPPHPEGYDVVFYVLDGEGIITIGVEQFNVSEGSLVFSPKEKKRGIKSLKRLSLLGIRESVREKTED
jgi:quercetin dioxygenase-like cupin family protein